MSLALADMLVINDQSLADMGATDVFNDAPLLSALNPIIANQGTQHKFRKETGAPTVGFRAVGAGRDHSKATRVAVTTDLKILDATMSIEAALADSDPRGRDHVLAIEGMAHLREALSQGEKQFLNGTGNDSDGFNGLADILDDLGNAMVIEMDTPAASQNCTDVWAIRTTSDERFLNLCVGNNGRIAIGQSYEQLLDGSNSKPRNCIVTPIEGWMTLILHSTKSAARLCNIDDSDSKLTDDGLYRLFELFDESHPPTHLVMNKRSGRQLRESRVATTTDGRAVPLPTDWDGIPIVYTKSVGYYTTANKIVAA